MAIYLAVTDGHPCPVNGIVVDGFTFRAPLPAEVPTTAEIDAVIDCINGSPFDTVHGFLESGGHPLNPTLLTCLASSQGETIYVSDFTSNHECIGKIVFSICT